jgi:serine/threonine protein kinase
MVENYEFITLLGKEPAGDIYLAERKLDHKRVLIKKIVRQNVTNDSYYAKTFKNQDFQCLIPVHDYFEDKVSVFAVMEFCENGPVSDLIEFHIKNGNQIEESV